MLQKGVLQIYLFIYLFIFRLCPSAGGVGARVATAAPARGGCHQRVLRGDPGGVLAASIRAETRRAGHPRLGKAAQARPLA